MLLLADGQDKYETKAVLGERRVCLSAPLKFKQVRQMILTMLTDTDAQVS